MGHANGTTPSNGNGHYQNGNGGRRHVPGAAPKTLPTAPAPGAEGGDKKPKKKGKKKEKGSGEAGSGAATPTGEASVRPSIDVTVVGTQTPGQGSVPPTPGAESLDPVAKKVRNLNKKLKAIDELKEKASRGERLEATQLKKMEGEAEIRKELSSLGITA
jgi:translation initiation factor 2A